MYAPKKAGSSTATTSPSLHRHFAVKSRICWLPETMSTVSFSFATGSYRLANARMVSRTEGTPSDTEYCSVATGFSRSNSSEKRAISSAGKESAAGFPPAKLMSVGSLICFKISRMIEGFMPCILSEI